MKYSKTDPRSWWKPAFKLKKEYPGFEGRWGLLVSEEGYTKSGVITIVKNPHRWPDNWEYIGQPPISYQQSYKPFFVPNRVALETTNY